MNLNFYINNIDEITTEIQEIRGSNEVASDEALEYWHTMLVDTRNALARLEQPERIKQRNTAAIVKAAS